MKDMCKLVTFGLQYPLIQHEFEEVKECTELRVDVFDKLIFVQNRCIAWLVRHCMQHILEICVPELPLRNLHVGVDIPSGLAG
jgi:hypothetical protein